MLMVLSVHTCMISFFYINNIVCTRTVFEKIVETLNAFIIFHFVKVVELRVQYIVYYSYVLHPHLVIVLENSNSSCRCKEPVACLSSSVVWCCRGYRSSLAEDYKTKERRHANSVHFQAPGKRPEAYESEI